jgi:hypothetical protein
MILTKPIQLFGASLIALSALLLFSCRKENFTSDSGAKLAFSVDTVLFDTVFSTIGSTTYYLKVYNKNDQAVRIDEVRLLGGSNSQYRINVDGVNGAVHNDIELRANDSMWVFVEVTVDPGNINTPFIVEDKIRFTTNGNEQFVVLNAWGQDAYFHGGLQQFNFLDCNEVWNNDKPHVVYGIVAVPENCRLTINQGTQVYCHARSGIYVYNATLDVNGSLDNEVVFQGDRLEQSFQDEPGQWGITLDFVFESNGVLEIASVSRGGIWISQSDDSEIDYAIIKNGTMGVQVDTVNADYNSIVFGLKIRNTRIENMSGIGLWGQGAAIQGINVLSANCGESCAYFSIGGKYVMDNCTFANYYSEGTRTAPAFALNNYYETVDGVIIERPLVGCRFTNCIMFGNNAFLSDFNETVLDLRTPESQDILFNSCLIDTDINVDQDSRFLNCPNGQAPPFCSTEDLNFRLSSNSGIMQGIPNGVGADLLSRQNGDWKGCYDFWQGSGNPCE